MLLVRVLVAVALLALPGTALAQLQVVSHTPALNNDTVPVGTVISVTFDLAVDTGTIDDDSFRAYGMWSGKATGSYSFSPDGKTVTLTPTNAFSAGEFVFVNLSHDIESNTAVALRSEGYAFQFITATQSAPATFALIDRFDNLTMGTTRIYGAAAADLNNDNYLDLATVNEDSDDVRVFLNLADGTGLYGPMLPREPIGHEASPNHPADFDNDGNMDLCVGAAGTHDIWVLLGAGDGTFPSITGISMGGGSEPHGIVPIDVDGDGDLDIISALVGGNELGMVINNGAGVFGAPTFFEGGVDGEYSLAVADMDGDGISDVVVAARNGSEIRTMLGNGNGTFTPAAGPEATGGQCWVVVLGDVNSDGDLDAACANSGSGTVSVLLGNGDGSFGTATDLNVGGHTPSVDLGDLDGDGDPDMVASSYGGGYWKWFSNDGGTFNAVYSFPAPDNPSCSVLLDFDNDGDLDMALTDEIDNTISLMENGGVSSCDPAPRNTCRQPTLERKSKLVLKNNPVTAERDVLAWAWRKGEATTKMELGNPTATDPYVLCLYEDDTLVEGWEIPAGELCGSQPCWKDVPPGYVYTDSARTPDGIRSARLVQGAFDGQARAKVRGKGPRLNMPTLTDLDGSLEVQLQRTNDALCFSAQFSHPFVRQDSDVLIALSDPPATSMVPNPVWSEIHSLVIAPACSTCHSGGGFGGLSGLDDCDTGYASLVNVASVQLPSMDRVTPTDPTNSWFMHKLDGTQGTFTAMCTGMFCGQQMPFGGPYLSMEVRDAIRTWIMNGALNDCP